MNQGDVYWLSLDPTLGYEQAGYRPVLIVSATAFNQATKMAVVLPITSGGNFAKKLGFAFELTDTKTQGIVRIDQPRTLDFSQRQAHYIETVSKLALQEILARFMTIFETDE